MKIFTDKCNLKYADEGNAAVLFDVFNGCLTKQDLAM